MALNAGDLVFIGWDSDNDDVVFLTTADIAAGEEIYFTDSEWNGTSFAPGEQVFKWTVPAGGVDAGSVVTIDMVSRGDGGPSATFSVGTNPGGTALGTVDYEQGGGALAQGNEQFWAVQGDYDPVARAIVPASPSEPINFINMIAQEEEGDPGGPVLTNTGLGPDTGTVTIDGDNDFMIFDPVLALGDKEFDEPPEVLRPVLLGLIGDESNWTTDDGGGNQNPGGGFDFNLGDLQGFPEPIGSDEVQTLFFLGDQVAFVSAVTSTGTASELTTAFNFEPTDLIEIEIVAKDIEQGGVVAGEFKFNEVVFTRVTVIREGVRYDLDIPPAAEVASSRDFPEAQGDSFFVTEDDVTIPAGLPFGPFSGTLAFSIDEPFLDSGGNPVNPVIERERPELDTNGDGSPDGGPPVTNANFNVSTTLTEPPIPCFVAGTLIDTPTGPRAMETLQPGDLVLTKDNGAQTLRWIGRASVPAYGDNIPILIRAGALGNDTDLRVSPQHRVLVADWRAELLFGVSECLVAARHLCDGTKILPDRTTPLVEYVHLLFDDHELVRTSGLWSESYFPGSYGLAEGTGPVERELKRLFPGRFGQQSPQMPVRPFLRGYEARLFGRSLTRS